MHYEELIKERAPKWPYPVNYGEENEVGCDVLVLGGGIAGCWAAIAAAKKGAKVVLVDKGATVSSGAGGGASSDLYTLIIERSDHGTCEEWRCTCMCRLRS